MSNGFQEIMLKEIKAPQTYKLNHLSIFLSGSIEMGKAEDWQSKVKRVLKDRDIILLNPRRDDWDDFWIQSIEDKRFKQQVEWELENLEKADIIIVNFIAGTSSPIILLELGLFKEKEIYVSCPKDYFRRGNVEIVCRRYKIPFFENLESLLEFIKTKIK